MREKQCCGNEEHRSFVPIHITRQMYLGLKRTVLIVGYDLSRGASHVQAVCQTAWRPAGLARRTA